MWWLVQSYNIGTQLAHGVLIRVLTVELTVTFSNPSEWAFRLVADSLTNSQESPTAWPTPKNQTEETKDVPRIVLKVYLCLCLSWCTECFTPPDWPFRCWCQQPTADRQLDQLSREADNIVQVKFLNIKVNLCLSWFWKCSFTPASATPLRLLLEYKKKRASQWRTSHLPCILCVWPYECFISFTWMHLHW